MSLFGAIMFLYEMSSLTVQTQVKAKKLHWDSRLGLMRPNTQEFNVSGTLIKMLLHTPINSTWTISPEFQYAIPE
ncbi:hypothetical protein A6R68_21825, partial [Neotoma lepida]